MSLYTPLSAALFASLLVGCSFSTVGELVGGDDAAPSADSSGPPRAGHDAGHTGGSRDSGSLADGGKNGSGDATAHDAEHQDAPSADKDGGHDAFAHDAPADTGPVRETGLGDSPPPDDAKLRDTGLPLDVAMHDARPPEDAGKRDASGKDASDATSSYPTTCAEAVPTGGATTSAQVTLYLDGKSTEPWTAICVGSGDTAKTYLKLPTANTSAYPLGNCATAEGGGDGVVTTWTMVAFDPTDLAVDTSDMAGATSRGHTYEVSGNGTITHDYTWMPFGSARSCVLNGTAAEGVIDLTGTNFVVASGQAFTPEGYMPSGANTTTGAKTTLTINGQPAGISACAADYYTDTGGKCLKLTYNANP